ncbi:hypothetical protein CC79DRAFT_909607 [Sarocladium strictum]
MRWEGIVPLICFLGMSARFPKSHRRQICCLMPAPSGPPGTLGSTDPGSASRLGLASTRTQESLVCGVGKGVVARISSLYGAPSAKISSSQINTQGGG